MGEALQQEGQAVEKQVKPMAFIIVLAVSLRQMVMVTAVGLAQQAGNQTACMVLAVTAAMAVFMSLFQLVLA
jgi:hypothetical protein